MKWPEGSDSCILFTMELFIKLAQYLIGLTGPKWGVKRQRLSMIHQESLCPRHHVQIKRDADVNISSWKLTRKFLFSDEASNSLHDGKHIPQLEYLVSDVRRCGAVVTRVHAMDGPRDTRTLRMLRPSRRIVRCDIHLPCAGHAAWLCWFRSSNSVPCKTTPSLPH